MEKQFFAKLSKAEYREGMEHRIFPDEIEADTWYKTRETCDEARSLGCYAVEALVNVKYIEPGTESNELCLQLLDADGQIIGSEARVKVDDNGIVYDPKDTSSEGYLMEYEDYPDIVIEGVAERIMAFTRAG